jgi:hypothetical protein
MHVPHDVKALTRGTLKRYLPLRGYWDGDSPDNVNRATLSRDLKTLNARGFIGLSGDYIWLTEAKPG